MAKGEPRETNAQPGPVRTSSGTRVAAVRLAPLDPDVTSKKGDNDVNQPPARDEMPTRELDLEQLRAMALRCASDVGADEPLAPAPVRPRLQLVFTDEAGIAPAPPSAAGTVIDRDEIEAPRPRRLGRTLLLLVLFALPLATVAALSAYGLLP
jgi:hypothetical protein